MRAADILAESGAGTLVGSLVGYLGVSAPAVLFDVALAPRLFALPFAGAILGVTMILAGMWLAQWRERTMTNETVRTATPHPLVGFVIAIPLGALLWALILAVIL